MKVLHFSEDSIERYALNTMSEEELGKFETHLLLCAKCRKSVSEIDLLVGTLKHSAQLADASHKQSGSERPRRLHRQEFLVEISGAPKAPTLKIGVLVLDVESDRLDYRFRRDLPQLDDVRGESLEQLASTIKLKANELGGKQCVAWLQGDHQTPVRVSVSASYSTEKSTSIADRLYEKNVHPMILPFRTHLPQYSIEAAAGNFGRKMKNSSEGWVEVRTEIPLNEHMFVIHVTGHSMEPMIPDASRCAFRADISGSCDGKILLIKHFGEAGGNRYTIKRCHLHKGTDPLRPETESVTLESINPAYKSRPTVSLENIEAVGEFLFVV